MKAVDLVSLKAVQAAMSSELLSGFQSQYFSFEFWGNLNCFSLAGKGT